jgi:hypothetical protein
MMNQELSLHAVLDTTLNDDERELVQKLFSDRGIEVTLETSDLETAAAQGISATTTGHEPGVQGAAGARDAAWTVMLYTRINEFARQIEPSALRDTIEELRTLRARQKKTSPAGGVLMLVDEDSGTRLDLEFQLPLRAYEDLATLNFRTVHADPLRFHRKTGPRGAWRGPH